MNSKLRFLRGRWWILGLALPLLATGPCVTIGIESVIDGFFNAVNPALIDAAAEELGLQSTSTSGGTTAAAGTAARRNGPQAIAMASNGVSESGEAGLSGVNAHDKAFARGNILQSSATSRVWPS